MGQQAAPVEIHRTGTQRCQLGQNAPVRFAMKRFRTALQTFQQRFLIPEAGFGTLDKPVHSRKQTLPGLLLQIHPKYVNLGFDELVANLACCVP